MTNKENIDRELREYLIKSENLRDADKLNYLRALFDKHFTFTKLDHMINQYDLFNIISDAKMEYNKIPLNPHVSGKVLQRSEFVAVSVIEAFVGYLNRNELIKKIPRVDYTDPTDSYDTLD